MSAQKRITRKDLKKDTLVTTTFRTTEFIQNHRQPFIIGLIAIVAVGMIVYYFSLSSAGKQSDSVVQLGKGDMAMLSGDPKSAIPDYEETINKYGSTISGRKAYILLGRAYNDSGDYEKAEKTFQEYLDKFDGKEPILLYRSALVGEAVALRNLGKKLDAADYYLKASNANPSNQEKAYLLLDAARCYRDGGNVDKAKELYQRVKTEFQYSVYENTAERELLELEK